MPPTHLVFRPVAPFDFEASLRFLAHFPATAGEQSIEGSVLTKALRVAGTSLVVRLTAAGSIDAPELRAELTPAGPVDEGAVADRLAFWLSLDDDLAPFYALAADDPPFAAVVRQLHGYHQVKFPSPVEIVCWSILVQRTQTRVAQAMKRRIISSFPENEVEGLWAFPDLEQLRTLDFAAVVRHERKASYLRSAIEALATVDETFLQDGPYDEVKAFLLAIPGIGPWSAMFVLIRGLGRMDEAPPDREGLAVASSVYGRALSEADFTALASRYGRWQAYWTHYLRAAP